MPPEELAEQEPAALAEMIQRALDKGLSYRELEERSGGAVKAQTFHKIVKGRHSMNFRNPDTTAQGLARALGEPERKVRVGMKLRAQPARIAWPERFNGLDPHQQKLVFDLIDQMLKAKVSDD